MTSPAHRSTQTLPLGERGLAVTRLGLGTAPLGNLGSAVSERAAHQTVQAALDSGWRLIDTAPLYGNGLAEQRLGTALARVPHPGVVVATKVGRLLRPAAETEPDPGQTHNGKPFYVDTPPLRPVFDFSSDATRTSLQQSLHRLGLDRVDLVHMHDPDNHLHDAITTCYPQLRRLREAGEISAISAGMNNADLLAQLVETIELDCVMIAGRLTLLDDSALGALLPACRRRNTAVLAAGVFNSGVLATGRGTFDYLPPSDAVMARVAALQAVCSRHDVALAAAALQYPTLFRGVTAVVVGARSREEAQLNDAMFNLTIPLDLWADLAAHGLIAPLPEGWEERATT